MAWIESHQTLEKHGKLLGLADALGITKHQAIGHLHCLWWWAIDSAPIGDISHYSIATIAAAAGWNEYQEYAYQLNQLHSFPKALSAGRFVAALIKSGFLDYSGDPTQLPETGPSGGQLMVHDWLDFCGDLVKKRLERQQEKRVKSSGIKSPHYRGNKSPPTVPYRTVPNRTLKTTATEGEAPARHGSFVFLTPEEHQKLTAQLGPNGVDRYIARLDGYIGQIGEAKARAKYKSHYHTILNWHRKDVDEGRAYAATDDGASRVDLKTLARTAREAKRAREAVTAGSVPAGVRDPEDVQVEDRGNPGGGES